MQSRKLVIFEEINPAFYSVVQEYLKRDFTIYFFKIDAKYKEKPTIKKHLEMRKLVNLSEMVFEYELYRMAVFHAHENVDNMFKNFASTASLRCVGKLLEYPEIENMYKKALLMILERIYETHLKTNEVITSNNPDEVYFYPSDYFQIHSDKSSPLLQRVNIIQHKSFRINIKNMIVKFKGIIGLLYPVSILIRKVRGVSIRKKRRREFKVGIRLHAPGLFSYNYYSMRLLVGDYGLPNNEILFIDEYNPSYEETCKNRGYNYTNVTKTKESLSFDLLWNKLLKGFFPAWVKCFFSSFVEKEFITAVTGTILTSYIKWSIFIDSYLIRNYVAILNPDDISKTHILSQNHVKTWLVYPDNSAADYHTGWDETIRATTTFSFMNYDCAVIYGDKIRRYFQNHRNNIREYIVIGVLPSQIVCELQKGKLKSELPSILKRKSLPDKIIAVFDTSYVDHGPLKIKDGIRFGDDIRKLLDELPDIGIIFKEKKFISYTPQLAPAYDKLRNHERCIFIPKTEEGGIFAPEAIAMSDLVISAAYTSTTAEALGAKKKAIYYDVVGHEVGDKYYFNRFPNLVAHSYEELKKLVYYWLYEITDEEFEGFLNKYVKGEIDPYLDGKAINRFRELLRG